MTCVTLGHILSNFPFQPHPPELLLQVLVHLICSWMDRISRAMRFIHYLTTELKILRNHQSILEP
jgi:hypothetical protein